MLRQVGVTFLGKSLLAARTIFGGRSLAGRRSSFLEPFRPLIIGKLLLLFLLEPLLLPLLLLFYLARAGCRHELLRLAGAVQGIGRDLHLGCRLLCVGLSRIEVAHRPLRTEAIVDCPFAFVLAQDGLILDIGRALGTSGGRLVEARGCLLRCGGIV